jgi:hypothetical protein
VSLTPRQTMTINSRRQWAIAALALGMSIGCNAAPPATTREHLGTVNLPTDDAILQTVYDQVDSLDLCDGFFQPEVAAVESRVYRLGDGPALVEVLCAQAAYQGVYAYVTYDSDGTVRSLSLEGFYPDATGQFVRSQQVTVGGLTTLDTDQRLLTVFSKARGLGDCGSLATYRWTGAELELATFRYQACSDSPNDAAATFNNPNTFPQIYP